MPTSGIPSIRRSTPHRRRARATAASVAMLPLLALTFAAWESAVVFAGAQLLRTVGLSH